MLDLKKKLKKLQVKQNELSAEIKEVNELIEIHEKLIGYNPDIKFTGSWGEFVPTQRCFYLSDKKSNKVKQDRLIKLIPNDEPDYDDGDIYFFEYINVKVKGKDIEVRLGSHESEVWEEIDCDSDTPKANYTFNKKALALLTSEYAGELVKRCIAFIEENKQYYNFKNVPAKIQKLINFS